MVSHYQQPNQALVAERQRALPPDEGVNQLIGQSYKLKTYVWVERNQLMLGALALFALLTAGLYTGLAR
jgi:hypothetical protein